MIINRILSFAITLLVFLHVCSYSIYANAEGYNFSFFKKLLGDGRPYRLMGGKDFTLECKKSIVKRVNDFNVMYIEEKEAIGCKLVVEKEIIDKAKGPVTIASELKHGEKVSVCVTPGSGMTNDAGVFPVKITGTEKGVDWIGWAIVDKKGEIDFSKKAYDSGKAWGVYIFVR